MSTDIKVSEAELPKFILSCGSIGALLDKLAGPLSKIALL